MAKWKREGKGKVRCQCQEETNQQTTNRHKIYWLHRFTCRVRISPSVFNSLQTVLYHRTTRGLHSQAYGGNAQGQSRQCTCYVCGGVGHPARLCPSGAESLWKEEEDETLHLGYFGLDTASLNSPLVTSEEWTKVLRQGSYKHDAHTWSFNVEIVWMNGRRAAAWMLDRCGLLMRT